MSPKSILPSAHYPDYLRQDLRIGEADVHPLAAALDEVFSKWFLLAQKSAHGLLPAAWSEETCEAALAYHGFFTSELSPAKRREFFRSLETLFATKGRLACLELLAKLYFGQARVERGRAPIAAIPKAGIRLPLRAVDGLARDRLIVVRIESQAEGLVAEFARNARRLMPDNFELLVSPEPVAPSKERKAMDFGKGIRLEKRRL